MNRFKSVERKLPMAIGAIVYLAMSGCVVTQDPATGPNTGPTVNQGAPDPRGPAGPDSPDTQDPGEDPVANEVPFTVSLERTACFGACPMYVVTVDDHGKVAWQGDRFVAQTGTAEDMLMANQVDQLRAAIEAADFFALKDCYCERRVTDMPSVIVTLEWDGQKKTVKHYTGDDSAPERLITLQKAIDSIIGTEKWIGKDATM